MRAGLECCRLETVSRGERLGVLGHVDEDCRQVPGREGHGQAVENLAGAFEDPFEDRPGIAQVAFGGGDHAEDRKGEVGCHTVARIFGDPDRLLEVGPGPPSDVVDVHDPAAWVGSVLVSPEEREALQAALSLGLSDVFRRFEQPPRSFTWWDYRAGAFQRNNGLRIDLLLTSAALAERCFMSPRNFARVFTREVGETPAVYVGSLRLERARMLLETTDLQLEQIARRSGFGTVETLRRAFGRRLRVSPSDYRERFQSSPRAASTVNVVPIRRAAS